MSADTHSVSGTALLFGAGAVILVAIIGIALLAGSDVTEYDPGTPEAAAQNYLQALIDEDYTTAHALLSPRLQIRCRDYELSREYGPEMDRVVFEDVRHLDTSTVITLRITTLGYSAEPLPSVMRDEIDSRLVLEQFDGDWRIVDADWPLDYCDWR